MSDIKIESKVVGKALRITIPYKRSIIDIIKAVPDSRWSSTGRYWSIPLRALLIESIIGRIPGFTESPIPLPRKIDTNELEIPHYLMQHQKLGLINSDKFDGRAYFHQTGTGKTVLGLEIINRKIKGGEAEGFRRPVKALVVCPLAVIEGAWIEDSDIFTKHLRIINLWEIRKQGLLSHVLNNGSYDIAVVNFETFKIIKKELQKVNFDILIVDESSKLKNPKSQVTKEIVDFSRDIRYRYIFSGSPAPNDPIEYYNQIDLVKPGRLGPSVSAFRYTYGIQDHFRNWRVNPARYEYLMEAISTCAEFVNKEDVIDLPERTNIKHLVSLNASERKAYIDLRDELVAEIEDNVITIDNALTKSLKLGQITSGFVYVDNEETGKRETVKIGSSKIRELNEVLEEIGNNQVIIWAQFKEEFKDIKNLLKDKCRIMNGDTPSKIRRELELGFKQGEYQYLVAHEKTLGHGVRLTNASYMVYYNLSYSSEGHEQSRDRMWRKGQKNHCTYIYLLAKGTIDMVKYGVLERKENVSKGCLTMLLNQTPN